MDNREKRPKTEMRRFVTRDPEQASVYLRQSTGASIIFEPLTSRGTSFYSAETLVLPTSFICRHRLVNIAAIRGAHDSVELFVPVGGAFKLGSGHKERIIHGNKMGLVAPLQTDSHTAERAESIILVVSATELSSRAERLSGRDHPKHWFSDIADPASSPAAQALARTMKGVFVEPIFSGDAQLGALAASGYEDILLNLLTATLCPDVVEAGPRDDAPNAALARRARDFLHAGATAPLDFSRLAADLGVSLRTLQQSFRRAYGLSPRAYLYQHRLELARLAMLSAAPESTVTDVALSCGFGDLSLFSAKYRRAFGEPPSQTLRAAKRR